MKIAAYLRVSTKDQREDIQVNDIQNFCTFKSWHDVTYFKDLGESGAKKSRPAFDDMMNRIRNKEFDVVLCWSFDRISRSTLQLVSLVEEFNELKVDFISLKQNIDTTTPMGRMIFTVFAALAQFERETIRQRTKAGIDLAKAKGVHCGRPETYTQDDRLEVLALFDEGLKPDKIAKKMKMHRATVYRIINEFKKTIG
jgi:DNA invertase Pin-like site-specific DNA recombinase